MKKLITVLLILASNIILYAQNDSGYEGSFDGSFVVGIDDYKYNHFEISTTHGIRVNENLFLGAGAAMQFFPEMTYPKDSSFPLDERKAQTECPIFANIKLSLTPDSNIAPYIDGRIGKYITNNGDLYAMAAVGIFINNYPGKISVSVGYTYGKIEYDTFGKFLAHSMNYITQKKLRNTEGISLSIGYTF